MKRFVVLLITVLALTGCSAESKDRQGGNGNGADRITDVDKAEVFRNIDNFPNIERICIDGIAFAATRSSTDSNDPLASNVIRVPEWDTKCGGNR